MGIGLVGLGHALPSRVRYNDDPILQDLRRDDEEARHFQGTSERRVLSDGEEIETFMIEAARMALDDAGLRPHDIDRLYGSAFVSRYMTPNGIYRVHRALGLRSDVLVVPVGNEFANFITASTLAWDALGAGRARHALVVCGASMTRHMDYSSPHAIAIGDAAAAAVLGESSRLVVRDTLTRTLSHAFDVMTMRPRALQRNGQRWVQLGDDGLPLPIWEMAEEGLATFVKEGAEVPPQMVAELLGRHGIDPSRAAFIGHQPARGLMDHWRTTMGVGEYWDTFDLIGNATMASVPATLSLRRPEMSADYLVLLSPGTGTCFSALLLER